MYEELTGWLALRILKRRNVGSIGVIINNLPSENAILRESWRNRSDYTIPASTCSPRIHERSSGGLIDWISNRLDRAEGAPEGNHSRGKNEAGRPVGSSLANGFEKTKSAHLFEDVVVGVYVGAFRVFVQRDHWGIMTDIGWYLRTC